jgi:Trk K+ transport system NAD-binding subunit
LSFGFTVEPLLVCIIGSFYVANFTSYRAEFIKIINDTGPYIYVVFFTLAGASLSLDIVADVAWIAIFLFFVRLISIMIGAMVGGTLAGDPPLFNRIGWMPYITQAGVGLGLATIIAHTFPEWGYELSTLLIAVIVISQVVGPPFFKWSINIVKEGHSKASNPSFDGIRDAIIFGFESQSIALARQLQENGWAVKVATFQQNVDKDHYPDLDIRQINDISIEVFKSLEANLSEAMVCMLTDDENYKICELAYEKLGTKDLIVRLNDRQNFDRFHQLGTLIVDPSTAIVSLLDHFVRSPQAASLLLGMETGQDSMDIDILNPDMHGLPLRDLRLPADLIILSISRGGHQLISHGYTRLRMGDSITVVGSKASIENVALRFGMQTAAIKV